MTNAKSYPVLYSFRRCPYAMRARMALYRAGVQCEIVEVDLKAKPAEMLALSPKGSVPVLLLESGEVLDESMVIMRWALANCDPEQWLPSSSLLSDELIAENDSLFKADLDRYKYPQRYPGGDNVTARSNALDYIHRLNDLLKGNKYILGKQLSMVDIAIFPFIRQFANVDAPWFSSQPLKDVQIWLNTLVNSELFKKVMEKNRSYLL